MNIFTSAADDSVPTHIGYAYDKRRNARIARASFAPQLDRTNSLMGVVLGTIFKSTTVSEYVWRETENSFCTILSLTKTYAEARSDEKA